MSDYVEAIEQGEGRVARDALCRGVHAELSFLGFLRPGEQVCLQREDVRDMLCRPERAKALGAQPFVCLPLMGGTKNDTTAPCGIVVCWETASALRVGDHVEALLEMYKPSDQETAGRVTHTRPRRDGLDSKLCTASSAPTDAETAAGARDGHRRQGCRERVYVQHLPTRR